MTAIALRPRSGSELVDAAFQLYRRHVTAFATVYAVALLPYLVVRAVTFRPAEIAMFEPTFLLVMMFGTGCGALAEAAVAVIASDGYLGGQAAPAADVLRRLLPRWPALALATFRKYLLIGLGLVFFIVPGVILIARYFAIPATLVLEPNGVGAAFRRSRALSAGMKGRIYAVLAPAWIIYAVCQQLLPSLLTSLIRNALAAEMAAQVFRIFVFPLVTVISTLLYYDLRIRKEAFDLEMMARAIGDAPAGQPAY